MREVLQKPKAIIILLILVYAVRVENDWFCRKHFTVIRMTFTPALKSRKD